MPLVLNMPQFEYIRNLPDSEYASLVQGSEHASGSLHARVLNIPRFSISQGSKYASGSQYATVEIYQNSDQDPESARFTLRV